MEEKYRALRERLEEIEFGALPEESCKSILREYRDELLEEIGIPSAMRLNTDVQISKIAREGSNSIREKKRTLRNFITSKKLEFLETPNISHEKGKRKRTISNSPRKKKK